MKKYITRRNVLRALVAGCIGDAFFIEPNISTTTKRNITLPNSNTSIDGLTIVQLTDFHYDPDGDDHLLESIVEKVNQLSPDLILLTGDYIDKDPTTFPPLLEHLARLKSKHGIYGCMGNHDGWNERGSFFRKGFQDIGIDLLINQNTSIKINGETIYIAATDFIWGGNPDPKRTLKGIPSDAPLITLVHEPDYFDTMLEYRDSFLQFSGHTHGGQCRVPIIGYAPRKVKFGKSYIYDIHSKQNSHLFVSRGIGTTGIPVRFACPPEIAHLTVKS